MVAVTHALTIDYFGGQKQEQAKVVAVSFSEQSVAKVHGCRHPRHGLGELGPRRRERVVGRRSKLVIVAQLSLPLYYVCTVRQLPIQKHTKRSRLSSSSSTTCPCISRSAALDTMENMPAGRDQYNTEHSRCTNVL